MRITELQSERSMRSAKRKKIAEFLKVIERRNGLIQVFDEELWYATVQQETVYAKDRVAVIFKNGETVEISY